MAAIKRGVIGGVTIFTRDVTTSAAFYSMTIGLKVLFQSSQFAELADRRDFRLTLQLASR
jgi:catechol-2,3-dioxygenase